MTGVGADVADLLPLGSVALTVTSIVWPASAAVSRYVGRGPEAQRPVAVAQFAPVAPQSFHV